MVTITVILAAVIAAFVLDIGDLDDGAPTADFDFDVEYDRENDGGTDAEAVLTITHSSGDTIDANELTVTHADEDDLTDISGVDPGSFSDEVSAGDEYELTYEYESGEGSLNDDVAVVWDGDGTSSTLAEHEIDIDWDPQP